MSAFFEMGGYAAFVWPSFLITAAVMVGLALASFRFLRANEAELRSLQGADDGAEDEA